jgi:putative FmdB family regulatory protein
MPLYTFECPRCKRSETAFRKIAERNEAPECRHGAGAIRMRRIVEAPAVQADLPGYTSPIDGRWIEGRRARTEDLKRSGCRPWEGMEAERKEAEKRSNEVDHVFERTIEAGVAEVYNGMSAESQRALQQL